MGVSERKEREREQRRNAILDAAEKIFITRGIDNATMDEVAEMAEFSKGTLYLYFKNKNELLHGLISRTLDMLYNNFKEASDKEEKGIEKISAIGHAYFDFFKKEPNHFSLMLHYETNEMNPTNFENNPNVKYCFDMGEKIFTLMRNCLQLGMDDGTIRNDIDPIKISLVLWGHSAGILHLFKAKEKIIKEMFHTGIDEIYSISHQLIRATLENHEKKVVKKSKKGEAK